MNQERLLEMLCNDTLKKVKKAARSCNVFTIGSKIDIIMWIKTAILTDDSKFIKIFSNIWGNPGGGLTFSRSHGVVYYLKFLLRSESSRDYIDGLLSMKHIPYVVVIDMALITAKHALVSRREDVQKYEYNEEGILFEPYSGRVADPDDSETVTNVKENNLELPFPWILQEHTNNQSHHPITNSDVHLWLFDRFHENNTSSEIESLRKIGCVLEIKGMFSNEVEEQLHLQFDSNKIFLNMMTPVTHIYLFRSILDHDNFNKNKTVTNLLHTRFKLIFDSFGRLQFETYANTNFHSPSSSSTLFEREVEDRLIKNKPLNIEDSLSEVSSECSSISCLSVKYKGNETF